MRVIEQQASPGCGGGRDVMAPGGGSKDSGELKTSSYSEKSAGRGA